MSKLYYTAPEQKIFDEVQVRAIELWYEIDTDDNKYGYASGKSRIVRSLKNVQDNFMCIVSMFDHNNQMRLANKLGGDARDAIRERIIDGGGGTEAFIF